MKIISAAERMPTVDGRYTVFVTDLLQRRWATPMISVWHNDRFDCAKPVYAWIGPWPTGLVDALWPMREFTVENVEVEYDL